MKKINLAIIGCGAVSELFHIPAALSSEKCNVVGVFDSNLDRARYIALKNKISLYDNDFKPHYEKFDAAILAVPNLLHFPVAMELLNNSKHVLIEKPMALSSDDCQKMIEISREKELTLSIGHIRRYYPENKFLKKIIDEKIFGDMLSVDVKEGYIFEWPMASNSFINKKLVGGGVLPDIGVHIIDLLHWWFDDFECVKYMDDGDGGLEADCEISFLTNKDQEINVQLSRQRNLENKIEIIFNKAIISVGCELNSLISLMLRKTNDFKLLGSINYQNTIVNFNHVMKEQVEDFILSILNKKDPFVTGESSRKSIVSLEKCYNKKLKIKYQWELV